MTREEKIMKEYKEFLDAEERKLDESHEKLVQQCKELDELIDHVSNKKENHMKKWIKAENGNVSQVIEFEDGHTIEIPLEKNGEIKWFDDNKLLKKGA